MTTKWNGSSVMAEFEKIAAESGLIVNDLNPDKKDFVGNPSTPTPVKDHRRYEPTEEYTKIGGEGKDIIEKAHPKTVEIAKAMGAGGVVENQIEQQEKNLEIATRMPSGALFGIHATLVKELAKKANELEEKGKIKEAIRIDKTIKRIADIPFDNGRPIKTAALFGALIGLVSLVAPIAYSYLRGGQATTSTRIGITNTMTKGRIPMGRVGKGVAMLGGAMTLLTAFGSKLTSRKEDLKTDLQDLYDILQKAKEKGSKSAADVAFLLKPFIGKFSRPLDEKNFKVFVKYFNDLQTSFPKIQAMMARVKIELGEGRWYHFGFDITSRLEEKYEDFVEVVEETKDLLAKAQNLGQKMDYVARRAQETPDIKPEDNVRKLQEILGIEITGEMDIETVAAAAKLEENIDEALKQLGIKRESSFKGKIVRGGQIVINLNKLERILQLIDEAVKKRRG